MRLKNDTENFAASFNITPPYQMRVIHRDTEQNGSATILSNTILWGAMEKTSLILRLAG